MIQSLILIDPKAEISANQDVNTLVLQPVDGKEIGIQEVRQLNRWAGQTSFADGLKRGVILRAHRLSRDAQQALLKTLEEPVADTQLVLTVDQVDHLLPTIQSRCAVVSQIDEAFIRDLGLVRNSNMAPAEVSMSFMELNQISEVERWQAMDKLTSQKGSLATHLQSWQSEMVDQLRQPHTLSSSIVGQLDLLNQSLTALQANVAPKLVADRLLLELASST